MKKILLFTIMLLMSSCVLDSEYQKVIKENQKLKDEIEEIKYGIPTLLEEAQTFFRIGNFLESKNRIDTLMKKYPTAVETIMAKKMLPAIEEELLWNKINEQNDLVLVQKYERKYPKGKYNKDIKNKKNEILLQIDKEAYERATNSNNHNVKKVLTVEEQQSPISLIIMDDLRQEAEQLKHSKVGTVEGTSASRLVQKQIFNR